MDDDDDDDDDQFSLLPFCYEDDFYFPEDDRY